MMNRVKTPCCSKCKAAYHITDKKNYRIPVLLNCGHDLCRICFKFMSKTNKSIICEICQAHTMIEKQHQLDNLPLHYYLIGKLWCLNLFKSQELNADISNLDMTRIPSMSLKLNENKCGKCGKSTDNLCQDCNLMFCTTCFEEMHFENKIYSQHKMITLDNTVSKLPQEFICHEHFRQLDCVCCTCRLKLCSVCANVHDQNEMFSDIVHEVVSLDKYNSYQLPRLTQLTTNGNYLLQSFISSKNIQNSFNSTDLTSFVDNAISKPLLKPHLDYSLVIEIEQNQIEVVSVTHVNSPSDFFLQLSKNQSLLKRITSEMNKITETEVIDIIEMNNVVYAVPYVTPDCKWFRGVVINMKMENYKMVYTVYCIDYGFTDYLTADRIYKAPKSIVSIPPLAYNCALYSLKPNATTGWSKTAITDFNCLILKKSGVYFMHSVNTHCEPIEVDVIWSYDIRPLSVRDAMFYLNHDFSYELSNLDFYEKLMKIITLPKPSQLQERASYPIDVSHLISPYEFYFRRIDDTATVLKQVMDELETKYQPTEKDKSYLLYSPQIGMAVAAKYSFDKNWYRAKITGLLEFRMVTVYYIDYGNSETLPWDQLRVLDKKFIQIPPLAIKACLADVKPIVNGIETTEWTTKAIDAFVQLIKPADNLTAYIQKIDDYDDNDGNHTHKVVVFNRWSREEFCVNLKLISKGLAISHDLESIVFKKPINRNSLKALSIQTNSRKKKTQLLSSEDLLAFTKQRSVIKSVNHSWKPNNNEDTPGIKMKVHKVVSPDDIILKYIDHKKIVKLTERMNNVYKKEKERFKNTDWKVKDLCAMFVKKYGHWYGGNILKVNTRQKTASVYMYDLEEIYDDIPIQTLYGLDTNCARDEYGFLHCAMSNLIPLGVSKSNWAKYSCDRLIEELMKYPYVYFLRQGKKRDKILGEIWVEDIATLDDLDPLCIRWININRFMIEQGLAMSDSQFEQVSKMKSKEKRINVKKSMITINHKNKDNS